MLHVSSLPRINKAINLLWAYNVKADVLIDIGCNNGALTELIAKAVNAKEAVRRKTRKRSE